MGCASSSKPVTDSSSQHGSPIQKRKAGTGATLEVLDKSETNNNEYFTQIMNSRSPTIRMDASERMKKLNIKGAQLNYTLHYCYVSQRGYYPDALGKANQDSYLVCESLLGDKSCNLFGIFDGHGETGDLCSHFAAHNLSMNLARELKQQGGLTALEGGKLLELLNAVHSKTNYALHSAEFDDSLSGTTAVTVLQRGDRLIVSNVGDSRAIIAKETNGKLVYAPLSTDQTPYRKDERERLKKAGARIMTIDQIEGNEPIHENFGTDLGEELDEGGDPPRVWDNSLEQPGCAFSRSIGDAVAKQCGVTALPEVLEHQLQDDDRFVIIASDGVFEFITSQGVVDMIAKFKDPIEAAKHIVQEAYRLWLTYDDRTDDITIIIIQLSNFKEVKQQSASSALTNGSSSAVGVGGMSPLKRGMSISHNLQQEVILKDVGNRPVRKVMSRRKRMDVMDFWDPSQEEDAAHSFDFDAVENKKTAQENARITAMLNSNFMFSNLNAMQREQILAVMNARSVRKGENIIREGDRGDEMYIVDSGQFTVSKRDTNGAEQVVFTYTREGSAFGELSLMYGKPRAASVEAKTDGKLWTIQRAAFRAVIMKQHKNQVGLLDMLQHIPHLQTLPVTVLHRLCQSCKEEWFEKGAVIVDEQSKPQLSWCFAVVVTGIVRFLAKEEGKKRQLRSEQTYFSLDEVGTKFTQVTADCKTKLLCIPQSVFASLVGEQLSASLKLEVQSKKCKGRRTQQQQRSALTKSMFLDPDTLHLPRIANPERFTLDHVVNAMGDTAEPFAFIGTFKDNDSAKYCSIKVIAKMRCHKARLSEKMLQERNYLASLYNYSDDGSSGAMQQWAFLPTVLATCADSSRCYVIYRDVLVCDFSMALQHSAVAVEQMPYFAAAVFTAITAVHEYGFIHRFVNPSAIYITSMGIPKLTDFRYAKRMDGTKSFTICGDPLFFAPEIVNSNGYDYSVDLWALGILIYEMYEKTTPFGTHETDETTIYRALSAYAPNSELSLPFSSANSTPAVAQQLLQLLLKFAPDQRAGYLDSNAVKSAPYFTGIDWASLPSQKGQQVDIQGSSEHQLFDDLLPYSSSVFDQF